MIDIGQKMCFVPHWYKGDNDSKDITRKKSVVGKVVYVNRRAKTFTVKYSICGGVQMKETFKWSQIGQDVHIVRGGRYGG